MSTVIIFDLETSGLNPYHDDIIEIGAKVYNEENSFQILLKPKSDRPISKRITDITGITNRLLSEEGLPWQNAYIEFHNWLFETTKDSENVVFVSHNGNTFDFIFLKRMLIDLNSIEGQQNNIDVSKIIFHDTLPLSKRLYSGRSYYSQPSLAKTFNIMIVNAHRAMGDVLVLEQLYPRLLKDLFNQEKIDGLKDPNKVVDYIDLNV